MKLNNIWGYGQLFGYSGIDGENRYYNDFVGTLTRQKIGIRFELPDWFTVRFAIRGRVRFRAVMSDFIDAETAQGDFFISFLDNDTLVGYAPVLPSFSYAGNRYAKSKYRGCETYFNGVDGIAVYSEQNGESYKFAISHSKNIGISSGVAKSAMQADVESLKAKRYAYYRDMPKCKDDRYERLYYKSLSINKVNVRSAEGKIPCRWTTPDRVPHRHMWLWDSAFHAMAIATYNGAMAQDALRAVLTQQRADGFIPCTMSPNGGDDVTQPQVLSWGVWEVYCRTHDKTFLRESAEPLERYLLWDKSNRDKNGNGMLEWYSDPEDLTCKCGESGLDNSPRFDFDEEMDALDFTCFQAHDAEYLSKIYYELDETEKGAYWAKEHAELKKKIIEQMYDAESGAFYDRLFNGELTKVLTPVSFLPLFTRLCTADQASRMVQRLTNEEELWTKAPIASISRKHPTYSTDMWRGGVWLNYNYFIIKGLKEYGYKELAESLREKTLKMVEKWYEKTGCVFEFYDPNDEVAPYYCDRKGKQPKTPDWRKHVHSIADYNWSACFTLLLIQREF